MDKANIQEKNYSKSRQEEMEMKKILDMKYMYDIFLVLTDTIKKFKSAIIVKYEKEGYFD